MANNRGQPPLNVEEATPTPPCTARRQAPLNCLLPPSWHLNPVGVPVGPPPQGAERDAEVERRRALLTEAKRGDPVFAVDSPR